MRVIAAGPLAAVGSAMPVKIAKGIIAAYPAPFGRPGPLGVPGPLLHLEANIDGVKSDAPQLENSLRTLDSLHFQFFTFQLLVRSLKSQPAWTQLSTFQFVLFQLSSLQSVRHLFTHPRFPSALFAV